MPYAKKKRPFGAKRPKSAEHAPKKKALQAASNDMETAEEITAAMGSAAVEKSAAEEVTATAELGPIPAPEGGGPVRPARGGKKHHRALWIAIIAVTAVALVLAGLMAWWMYHLDQEAKEAAVTAALPRIVVPEGHFTPVAYSYTFDENVRAIELKPGVDLYKEFDTDEAALSAEVDAIIAKAKELGMNAIVVDTDVNGRVIFASSYLQASNVDLLKIICEKATANEMAVSVVFHVTGFTTIDGGSLVSAVDDGVRGIAADAAAELAANYDIRSIMLDGYFAETDGTTYAAYVAAGGTAAYGDWLVEAVGATVSDVALAVRSAKDSVPVGLCAPAVWANADTEGGSATKAAYQALIDGHADTKGFAETKMVDFVNISISTSTDDPNTPFKTALEWWGNLCRTGGIPLYVTHSAENAGNGSLTGWSGTDELAKQVALALKAGGYHGSIFSGYTNLVANPGGCTDILLKYFNNEYKEAELFQGLDMTSPTKLNFSTEEETVQFRMKFDPNAEVTLNGEKVTPSERGGASIWVPLKVGMNTIVLEHKGKKITYNIDRKVTIFKSVSPSKAMKVAGGSTIELSVMAYKGSSISATLAGQTVKLTEGGGGEDNNAESAYLTYTGSIPVGKATAKEQPIGAIKFTGSYQGVTQYAQGGNITIDKLPDEVDPDEATGQILTMATVTDRYANTYPYKTTPSYPQAILYQLPQGTTDIVVSQSGDFLNLRSGKTIKRGATTVEEQAFPGNNAITNVTYGVEGNDTVIRLTMNWRSPFSLNLSPYPDSFEATGGRHAYTFQANKVTLLFDYVTTKGQVSGSLDGSPIFSGVPNMERVKNTTTGIWQYKMELPLNQTGRYYGCHAEWEDNTLVLRFNHPASGGSLSGMKIAIDPGHGGSEPGNMAGRDAIEKDLNLIQGMKLGAALEALGAQVVYTRTSDATVSLSQRVEIAEANQVDLFISCHQNSSPTNPNARGSQVYFNAPFSQPLAQYIIAQLGPVLGETKWTDWYGPVSKYNFQVTREKQYPSVLIEFAFLSNAEDEAMAIDDSYQDMMAQAIAQGVLDYYAAYN